MGQGGGGGRLRFHSQEGILGGSWVVISGVISRVTIVITQIRGLITPLITTMNLQVGV